MPASEVARRRRKLRLIFTGLALLSVIINLDGGAVPGSLIHIERTFMLSTTEIGLVGMLVYQGIALGCLCVGPLLRVVSPIRATQVTLILNTGATLAFGLTLLLATFVAPDGLAGLLSRLTERLRGSARGSARRSGGSGSAAASDRVGAE